MSTPAVLRATQMFTKHGNSKNVSFLRELAIGSGLGLTFGLLWKVHHWNEKRKIEQYYYDLAKMEKQKLAES